MNSDLSDNHQNQEQNDLLENNEQNKSILNDSSNQKIEKQAENQQESQNYKNQIQNNSLQNSEIKDMNNQNDDFKDEKQLKSEKEEQEEEVEEDEEIDFDQNLQKQYSDLQQENFEFQNKSQNENEEQNQNKLDKLQEKNEENYEKQINNSNVQNKKIEKSDSDDEDDIIKQQEEYRKKMLQKFQEQNENEKSDQKNKNSIQENNQNKDDKIIQQQISDNDSDEQIEESKNNYNNNKSENLNKENNKNINLFEQFQQKKDQQLNQNFSFLNEEEPTLEKQQINQIIENLPQEIKEKLSQKMEQDIIPQYQELVLEQARKILKELELIIQAVESKMNQNIEQQENINLNVNQDQEQQLERLFSLNDEIQKKQKYLKEFKSENFAQIQDYTEKVQSLNQNILNINDKFIKNFSQSLNELVQNNYKKRIQTQIQNQIQNLIQTFIISEQKTTIQDVANKIIPLDEEKLVEFIVSQSTKSVDQTEAEKLARETQEKILQQKVDKQFKNIGNFLRNPENIIKCIILSLLLVFFSNLSQFLQGFENGSYQIKDILIQLEHSKNTRALVLTGTITLVSFFWYIIKMIWVMVIGQLSQQKEKRIRDYLLSHNPILQLYIISITDETLIENKFEIAIWFSLFFVFSTFRVFLEDANDTIKTLLSCINQEYSQEKKIVKKLQKFIIVSFFFNLLFCSFGIWVFWSQGFYILFLMYYWGLVFSIESLKSIFIIQKLKNNFKFYIDNNTDQINEPFYQTQIIFDILLGVCKLAHYGYLIYNYFSSISYHVIKHLWFLYPLKQTQQGLYDIKVNVQNYGRFKKIQREIDVICPKVKPEEIEDEDRCSICHDDLKVARKLSQCGHKFHIKCLFNWLKNQKNSKCPVCRQDIKNLLNQDAHNQNNSGFFYSLYRIFNFLTNFSIGGISIQLVTVNGAQVPNNNNNNQPQQQQPQQNNNNNVQNQNNNQENQNQNQQNNLNQGANIENLNVGQAQ